MALIQRYTTELTAQAATNYRIQEEKQSIEEVLNQISTIKQQDADEKRYLHSLNDRLEELLRNLNDLELANKNLRDALNNLITSWGVNSENRIEFLKELDLIINHITEQNRQKVLAQGQTRIFDERTQLTDRIANVFADITHLYRDKSQILLEISNDLEDELRQIRLRLDISHNQVKSHDDEYQKQLAKFRSYLTEWSQLTLDKQYLLNEIQSLRERFNLRLAYNQEEINEWQRLLNRIAQESKHFYRDYLDTVKQQIQLDYEQMTKDQQSDIELQLQSRLKQIHERIELGLPIDENDERRRREEKEKFDNRLEQSTKQYDNLQNDFRNINEEIQNKRRLLKDLENELRNKHRQNAEQHLRLEYNTNLTKNQYLTMRNELDKLAYQLRFSVEEELKIYEALLNSFQKKNSSPLITKISTDRKSSTDESTGFSRMHIESSTIPKIPIDSTEITRKFTSKTNYDDLFKYRPSTSITQTTITTKKTDDSPLPTIRIEPPEKVNNQWTYETLTSGTTSSAHDDGTDRERAIVPSLDQYAAGLQQDRTTTTTTKTTRRFGHGNSGQQQQQQRESSTARKEQTATISTIPEVDEKFLQSKIHITRKYKGNILIKFVDVSGRFVEIENTGNTSRDLTGWYIERTIDGNKIDYTFPTYELPAHKTVKVYGNYHRRSPTPTDDQQLQLIASNFYDWGNGKFMRTELFNRDDVGKALFEQTIRD